MSCTQDQDAGAPFGRSTTKRKQHCVGQRFHMKATAAIVVSGIKVIPVGSPTIDEITDVRRKTYGESRDISARISIT